MMVVMIIVKYYAHVMVMVIMIDKMILLVGLLAFKQNW